MLRLNFFLKMPTQNEISIKIQNIIHYVFPILKIETFPQLVNGDLILSKHRDVKTMTSNSFIFFIYALNILTGFQIPFLEDLHALTTPVFGSAGRLAFLLASFAVCEVILIRIWIFCKLRMCRTMMEIDFVKLILEAKEPVQKKILFWTKFFLLQVQFGAYQSCFLIHTVEYFNSNHPLKLLRLILWSYGHFSMVRIGIHHIFLVISFTFVGLNVLMHEISEIKTLIEINLTRITTNYLVYKYLYFIKLVKKMNSMTKFLLFISSIFNIPFMSIVLYFVAIPTNGLIVKILRIFIVLTVVFYSCRVYILTAIFSKVDKESKRIYSDINSAIARGKVTNYTEYRRLLFIMEDLSALYNHFLIREYNSAVTQIDTFNNIINTISIVIL